MSYVEYPVKLVVRMLFLTTFKLLIVSLSSLLYVVLALLVIPAMCIVTVCYLR